MSSNDHLVRMILEPRSVERLDRIRIASKERAHEIENKVIAIFNSNGAALSDASFVEIVSEFENNRDKTSVVFQRRKKGTDLDDIGDL